MSSAVYFRLFGQATSLTVHGVNSLVMLMSMMDDELTRDPAIKTMVSLQGQYLTVWNITFQMFYFTLAFICDILTVTGKDNLLPKSIRKFRQNFFAIVVWPYTMLIFTVFWPIFIADRSLLFPAFIDKIFSFKSNLVMHFFIFPAALWELVFSPRLLPKDHSQNVTYSSMLYLVYVVWVLITYLQRGVWPYPIVKLLFGTIYFPLFLIATYSGLVMCYYSQWKITTTIWGQEKRVTKFK